MGTSDLAGHVVVARDVRSRRLHELLGHLDPGAPRRGIVERRISNRNDRVGIVAGINDDLRGLSLRLRIVPMWTSLALVAVIPSAVVMLGIVVEYIPNGYVVPLNLGRLRRDASASSNKRISAGRGRKRILTGLPTGWVDRSTPQPFDRPRPRIPSRLLQFAATAHPAPLVVPRTSFRFRSDALQSAARPADRSACRTAGPTAISTKTSLHGWGTHAVLRGGNG
jgi:hypothetical protein